MVRSKRALPPGLSPQGLTILYGGRHVRLKWHRLRRRMGAPLFGVQALQDGLRVGASMELDLRVRRDGGFVVLHNATLDAETTGAGSVAEHTAEQLRTLRLRPGFTPLIFSEDLATLLRAASPDALLQFDMKDSLATIGGRGMDHLATWFAQTPTPIIVGGKCLDLIVEIGRCVPTLRRGIDPTDMLVEHYRRTGIGAVEAELLTSLRGPARPDTVYLAWPLLLRAMKDGSDLVGLCHREGVLVDAWTFNMANPDAGFSEREWQDVLALLELGVDQITTDEAIATEAAYIQRAAA